jgi:hypothetical protein
LAIKYHPDKGGDPKKFQEIHDAYERIIEGKSSKSSKQTILESYLNIDMRRFFENYRFAKKHVQEKVDKDIEPLLGAVRAKAVGLFVRGVLEALIGGLITLASYNSASSKGGYYTIFYGLIIVGAWNALKGLYYMINPKSLIKKIGGQGE